MAKGHNIMSNRSQTSDMVGSIDDGSSTMSADLDRKGGRIMSNRPWTSDMSGAMVDILGAETDKPAEKPSVAKDDKKIDDAKHAKAALTIDKRIEKLLKPKYASCYASAASTKSRDKFLSNTMECLFGMASDDGISAMVNNVADVEKEIGGLALLQRAMVRRLTERSSYMTHGWLARLFQKEKKTEDLLGTPGAKTAGFYDDRKGTGVMGNKSMTSSMSSGFDIIGAQMIVGAEMLVGAQMAIGAEMMVRGESCGVSLADAAKASMKMDARVAGQLLPYWAAIYKIATTGSKAERLCATNSFMIAMLSDEGLRGMVKSMGKVDAEFGNVGMLQRAIGRRFADAMGVVGCKPEAASSAGCYR